MNSWEGRAWHDLSGEIQVTGFCAKNNLYPTVDLKYPIVRLKTSTDNKLLSKLSTFRGVFQKMNGLDKLLNDFDIAHTVEIYNYYTYQAALAKKHNSRLKIVTTVWDNSPARFDQNFWGPLKRPGFITQKIKEMIKYNAEHVDCFLAVSKQSAKILIEEWGVKEEKIKVVWPGLSPVEMKIDNDILRQIPKGAYLMVNRLRVEKGVYDVIMAWNIFIKQTSIKNPLLVVVGDGPERNNFLKLISKLKIGNTVKYFKNLPNDTVRTLYNSARGLVLGSVPTPLWQEQFGYVLAEAMSAGCPVISTRSGAIPEVVSNGGIIIEPGNYEAMASAMLAFESDEVWKKYHDAAIVSATRFDIDIFKKELLNAYIGLV
jgi:glycosyltransferase involved in cell wall biosynthesis